MTQDDITWGMDGTWSVGLKNNWKESDGKTELSSKSSKVICMSVYLKTLNFSLYCPKRLNFDKSIDISRFIFDTLSQDLFAEIHGLPERWRIGGAQSTDTWPLTESCQSSSDNWRKLCYLASESPYASDFYDFFWKKIL